MRRFIGFIFTGVLFIGLLMGVSTQAMTSQAQPTVSTASAVKLMDSGDTLVRREIADTRQAVKQAVKVAVANKKPCRTKKSSRCTWADSYHHGDTLSWWRGTGRRWNVTNKRARDRLQEFFHAMYGDYAGALKFGGTLHPYCWWNDAGTAVLCGDGARKSY